MTTYIFISDLPDFCTKNEIDMIFGTIFEVKRIFISLYKVNSIYYDYHSAFLILNKVVPNEIIRQILSKDFFIREKKVSVSYFENDEQILKTFLLFGPNKANLEVILAEKGLPGDSIKPIDKGVHSCRFPDRDKAKEALRNVKEVQAIPVINPDPIQYSPMDNIRTSYENHTCHNFHLIHLNKKYGVIKSIASEFSSVIKNTKSNEIILPPIPGPIEDIVDYCNMVNISVTPEKYSFLLQMGYLLDLKSLITTVMTSIGKDFVPSNCLSYVTSLESCPEAVRLICNLISRNYSDYSSIVNLFPEEFARIIEEFKNVKRIPAK